MQDATNPSPFDYSAAAVPGAPRTASGTGGQWGDHSREGDDFMLCIGFPHCSDPSTTPRFWESEGREIDGWRRREYPDCSDNPWA